VTDDTQRWELIIDGKRIVLRASTATSMPFEVDEAQMPTDWVERQKRVAARREGKSDDLPLAFDPLEMPVGSVLRRIS
jgi:hypothetical protein